MGNQCQRKSKKKQAISDQENSNSSSSICLKHKLHSDFICLEKGCPKLGYLCCSRCLQEEHVNHQVDQIDYVESEIQKKSLTLQHLAENVRQKKSFNSMRQMGKDLYAPFIKSDQLHTTTVNILEESLRLKLERKAASLLQIKEKDITEEENTVVNQLKDLVLLANNPENQQLIFQHLFSSNFSEQIKFNIYKNARQICQAAQNMNPYRFNYQNFKNQQGKTLTLPNSTECMKLRTCCRINHRFAAVHFRNNKSISEFYIIDLLEETVVYQSKHTPKIQRGQEDAVLPTLVPDSLFKISYLGSFFICFNFISKILIQDFRRFIQKQTISSSIPNVSSSSHSKTTILKIIASSRSKKTNKEIKLPVICIMPNHNVSSVDGLKCGELCLIETQPDWNLELREYSIWNFRKKICIRKLNFQGHNLYDIFGNHVVLEKTAYSFSLFNWQCNYIEKSYDNLLLLLQSYIAKNNKQEHHYNLQAVKIFAIQKLLTTKEDYFLNSQPSFDDWMDSLPFQHKSMVIFEDTWLFKYDRTAIIMLTNSLLLYDMNLNQVISNIELNFPSDQISFIWQVTGKLVFVTKDGSFLFYS